MWIEGALVLYGGGAKKGREWGLVLFAVAV